MDYKCIGIDRPYTTLYFHKDCIQTIRSSISGSMYIEEYILMNIPKLEKFVGYVLKPEPKQKSKLLTKGK